MACLCRRPVIAATVFLFAALAVGAAANAGHGQPDGESAAQLVEAAIERARHRVTYDGSYRRIAYPMGDVPANIGVCTDVVIRSYRAAFGIDLQRHVHEDMTRDFTAYPDLWNLDRPDPNIDHRRVPNLEAFFNRHAEVLPITDDPADYGPGDVVTWRLSGTGLPHIGIITDRHAPLTGNPIVAHNIGRGPELDDMLFDYRITGHFRFLPAQRPGATE